MTKPKPKPPPPAVLHHKPPSSAIVREFQRECNVLSAPDTETPFRSVENAVERLIVYHTLATEEGDDADVDESCDGSGSNLLCSRRDAWQSMCLKKSTEFYGRILRIRERLDKIEGQTALLDQQKPEEAYMLHSICLQEAKRLKRSPDNNASSEEEKS
mmetsp:Transcript_4691/g.13018  ORF Transcript_4691/g.13018 Transcript_4691/m.13018 type:complete len:158 (+) Transcript_4691:249-722(+)|eukprot:CAMPEP_0117657230 /NCGR_PEP_ID=MMETSP0804-20121206/5220_1 /TAXON_ID=1074897 /ORGANISM="Tetraselmis astigmatica, Strain CCMP880" /LENGTH=157 /DNA_ID=CAMNT_0005463671 /DNA_START=187 /DNA_END=660 /DNA_ORIENTATION=-